MYNDTADLPACRAYLKSVKFYFLKMLPILIVYIVLETRRCITVALHKTCETELFYLGSVGISEY